MLDFAKPISYPLMVELAENPKLPPEPHWLARVEWDIQTRDAGQVHKQVSRYLKNSRLTLTPGQGYEAKLVRRQLHHTGLMIIEYGAVVELDAGMLGSFSLLQRPVVGSYELIADGRSVTVDSTQAHLIAPHVPVKMRWSADCVLLVVRLAAQGAIELGLTMADARNNPARPFGPTGIVIDLADDVGASLDTTLGYVASESTIAGRVLAGPDGAKLAERLLLQSLRHTLGQTRQEPTARASESDAPPYLQLAETFLLNNLAASVTLDAVAAASGVSAATITQGFRAYHSVGPMKWWRLARLDRAFEDLSKAHQTPVTVTEIGLKWGFAHLGRFSRAYRKRFGELPRATLQRARAEVRP